MYHFISGYTAKVAGTEAGITEPQIVFSACFGEPFLPLHPTVYAAMLGKKMEEHTVNVWLVNTGWSGGPFGTGSRIKLKYTRALISAALNGDFEDVEFQEHQIFGILMPTTCPGVPENLLNPQNTWEDKNNYSLKASALAERFIENFKKFSDFANEEILQGAPKIKESQKA
jgi:phosphoenolpyruvate carboxykinase (ATP)